MRNLMSFLYLFLYSICLFSLDDFKILSSSSVLSNLIFNVPCKTFHFLKKCLVFIDMTATVGFQFCQTKKKKRKVKAFSLKCRTRLGCPVSPLLFSIVLEVLVMAVRQGKKKLSKLGWRKWDCHYKQIIWYYIWKILKTPHKKLLELINSARCEGYKINTQICWIYLQ